MLILHMAIYYRSSYIFHQKKLLINIFVTGILGGLVAVTGKYEDQTHLHVYIIFKTSLP